MRRKNTSINDENEKEPLVENKEKKIPKKSTNVVLPSMIFGCFSIQTVLLFLLFLSIVMCVLLFFILFSSRKEEVSIESLFQKTNVECGYSCSQMCVDSNFDCFDSCYKKCNTPDSEKFSKGLFSNYIKPNAIQHFGITVVNLTRTTNFFIDMLGGVLVEGAGGDGWFGNTVQELLTQKELLQAKLHNESLSDWQIANLYDDGSDRLAASYVNFGSVQIELLDYRARSESLQKESFLPFTHHSTSPSIKNNMHLSFRIKDDVDLNSFVQDFESKCWENGYIEVECNRVVPVKDEEERKEYGWKFPQYNSFEVTGSENPFDGWGIVYCKSVEEIQIEFNTVKRAAKKDFDEAFMKYIS